MIAPIPTANDRRIRIARRRRGIGEPTPEIGAEDEEQRRDRRDDRGRRWQGRDREVRPEPHRSVVQHDDVCRIRDRQNERRRVRHEDAREGIRKDGDHQRAAERDDERREDEHGCVVRESHRDKRGDGGDQDEQAIPAPIGVAPREHRQPVDDPALLGDRGDDE